MPSVRLLSLPPLYVIWLTPTNFTVIQKPLDNFLEKLDNPEINHQFILPPSFKDIENKERQLNWTSNVTNFPPPDFVFTSEHPHYSLALFASFIYQCTNSSKKLICIEKAPPQQN